MMDHELARERMNSLMREAEHARLAAVARAARTGARPDDSRPRLALHLRLRRLVATPWFAAPQPCDGVETR
jgi:hypothetical protein